jgi:hypothetical protein
LFKRVRSFNKAVVLFDFQFELFKPVFGKLSRNDNAAKRACRAARKSYEGNDDFAEYFFFLLYRLLS